MKEIPLGTYFQIPVKLHWTFLLFMPLLVSMSLPENYTTYNLIAYISIIFLLFLCVTLHEYGHALAARRYGVRTLDIILTPIGGVARLERMPNKPLQELWIALAGPAVNVLICLLLATFFYSTLFSSFFSSFEFETPNDDMRNAIFIPILQTLFIGNIIMVLFNMIPAFPMDGGRVLRALIAMKWSRLTATFIAATLGKIICVLFIGIGFWQEMYSLAFIGVFIFLSAQQELNYVRHEHLLENTIVKDVMRTQYSPIFFYQTIQNALDLNKATGEKDFIVLDNDGEAALILPFEAIQEAEKKGDIYSSVVPYSYICEGQTAPNESLKQAIDTMHTHRLPFMPVNYNATPLGILFLSDVEHLIKKQTQQKNISHFISKIKKFARL